MPSRIIREDILTSSRIDELDPPAEVFYRRLLSKCDDHGLYDARPAILRASLFPLRIDRVREADCSRWMAACQKAGLIVLYSHDGRPYLQVLNTRWAARSEPKYPLPPSVNSCTQVQTLVPVVVDVVVSESVVDKPAKPARSPTKVAMPEGFCLSDKVRAWAEEKGHWRLEDHLESFKAKCAANGYKYVDWDAALMNAIRDDWAKLGAKPTARPASPTAKDALRGTESKLEAAIGYARQQASLYDWTPAKLETEIALAKAKFG
jgi:hypothetical protein